MISLRSIEGNNPPMQINGCPTITQLRKIPQTRGNLKVLAIRTLREREEEEPAGVVEVVEVEGKEDPE